MVVQFLARSHPDILQNTVQFYHQEENGFCSCGVKIEKDIFHDENLHTIHYENTTFAILHFRGIHAFSGASTQLLAWLRENGFTPSGNPFAVYDTTESEDDPNMMVYCPLVI